MKIHRVHIDYAIEMFREVMTKNRQSEDVWRTYAALHKEWGKRDRAFIANLFYSLLRYQRYYQTILSKLNIKEEDDFLLAGVYAALQGYYSGKHAWWPQFSAEEIKYIANEKDLLPAELLSIPDWLYQRYPNALIWEKLNQPAPVYIRVNTLKTTQARLVKEFEKESVEYTIVGENVISVEQKMQLTKHTLYQSGWFEIQDISSQQVVPFLQVEPGMVVLDACAGAGGKSLHLAAAMKNQGIIISTDVHTHKLQQLQLRAKRAGATMIDTTLLNDKFVQHHITHFHRILADVPCSGTGTIRRKPEIKWKLTEQRLHEYISLQRNILQQAVCMLQPGGKLVYSTCSILPDENEQQVEWLLKEFSHLELEASQRLEPTHGGDGFFMARVKARDTIPKRYVKFGFYIYSWLVLSPTIFALGWCYHQPFSPFVSHFSPFVSHSLLLKICPRWKRHGTQPAGYGY
jgi:16S rRNA (cytosine967-C5)-methyltransferase